MLKAPLELQFANTLHDLKIKGFTHVAFRKHKEEARPGTLIDILFFEPHEKDKELIVNKKICVIRVRDKEITDVMKMLEEISKDYSFEVIEDNVYQVENIKRLPSS